MTKLFRRLSLLIVVSLTAIFALSPCALAAEKNTTLELTPEEEGYIASHKTVKIGYVQDRIPVSFSDENGEFAGISRYIFDRVSELSGLDFEYVPLPAGDVKYEYLLGEGLDLVSSVEYNKENQKARGILMSDPYLSSRKVIVARKDLEFSYSADLSIAISTGSQTLRKVLNDSYPNFELVDYPSIEACFDAVNSGEADLMLQNQYVAEYWFSKPIYEDLQVLPILGLDDEMCFSAVVTFEGYENAEGMSPAEGRILIDLLNKAIAAITEDETGGYTIQAIMENQYTYTLSDFMYRYRFAMFILSVSTVIVVVLAILLVRQRIRLAENKADAKAKSQFLSTMSHEIRTPLNGLIGLNYLMSQKLEDKEHLKVYLNQSTVTANYLLSLVNDILDMSKLQEDKMEILHRPVNLELLLDTVNSIVRTSISDKGLNYSVDSDFICPCVTGDETRIQQVILNLLDNARKFTDNGGSVELRLRQQKTSDEKILTTVTVSDTGRGISEEFQKHLFDAFAQELSTVSKGNQGTGLGLPISRRLAVLMGGDLTFTSKKGEGSTFVFTFTCEPAEDCDSAEKPESHADVRNRELRILVAEDNELNGEIIVELLASNGFDVVLAENGKEALEIFSASRPNTFDVILMDLLMPEMDGFAASKAIRELDRPDAKSVLIFACTANAFSEDRDKALDSGMDDFISKPINVEQLLIKLSKADRIRHD